PFYRIEWRRPHPLTIRLIFLGCNGCCGWPIVALHVTTDGAMLKVAILHHIFAHRGRHDHCSACAQKRIPDAPYAPWRVVSSRMAYAPSCLLPHPYRLCQVVEAETRSRQAGASPRSSPPFRQPALYL